MAILIDGKALAAKVKAQVREEAAKMVKKPGLAVCSCAAQAGYHGTQYR